MKKLALAGFVIWLVATIALRLAGQWVIRADTADSIAALLLVSAPLMFALPRRLFSTLAVAPADYARGAIALVTPGMLLDTIGIIGFARVFPNMPPEAAGVFGGWLLFCNMIALVSAVTLRPTPSR